MHVRPELTRRIVQIAVAAAEQADDVVLALCNDSSIWLLVWSRDGGETRERWVRLADIPQD